jgi:hypothetical protein
VDRAAIDWLTGAALDTLDSGADLPVPALQWLLRSYAHAPDAGRFAALGPALAQAVLAPHEGGRFGAVDRLRLIADAAGISDDERLPAAAWAAAVEARAEWAGRAVGPSLCSVDACLRAAPVLALQDAEHANAFLAAAIDELERVVAQSYAPGEGLAHDRRQPDGPRGAMSDHIGACDALLTAYEVTDRLPYPMLAAELMEFVRQTWRDPVRGVFHNVAPPDGGKSADHSGGQTLAPDVFTANCNAARLLVRLAALHDDDYCQRAVIAPGRDYARDAEGLLALLESDCRGHGVDAAPYALALEEWLGLGDRRDLK